MTEPTGEPLLAPLLKVRLSAGYGRTGILRDVRFDLQSGEALGLIGTSGAGKSTLVLALLGLLPWRGGFATGEVLFEGKNLLAMPEREARRLRGRRFALVPQSPMTALNGALSLAAHFKQAWKAHRAVNENRNQTRNPPQDALWPRVQELLEQVQLPGGPEFLARRPGAISVGQAQRVLIALALLHRPSLLIADEPTRALDPVTQTEIIRLQRRLHREEGTALLYISHDLTSVLQLCDRLAVLDRGSIVECLAADAIGEQARHPSTLALLETLPVPADVLRAYRNREAGSPGHPATNAATHAGA